MLLAQRPQTQKRSGALAFAVLLLLWGCVTSRDSAPLKRPPRVCAQVANPPECRRALKEAVANWPERVWSEVTASCHRPEARTLIELKQADGFAAPQMMDGGTLAQTPTFVEGGFEGYSLTRCTLATDGSLRECCTLMTMPGLDDDILDAISTWRMKPASVEGQSVEVDYFIPWKFIVRRHVHPTR